MKGKAPALLTLSSRRREGDVVIEVGGELDLATAPLLQSAFAEALDQHGCRVAVLVDLRAVDFMGSTGLSVLLDAKDQLQSAGRGLSLVRPSPAVMRTLQLAGLLSTFAISDAAPDDLARA